MPAETKTTGWQPGMLQDDNRKLSRWLASRPGARGQVRELCREIASLVKETKHARADKTSLAQQVSCRYSNATRSENV